MRDRAGGWIYETTGHDNPQRQTDWRRWTNYLASIRGLRRNPYISPPPDRNMFAASAARARLTGHQKRRFKQQEDLLIRYASTIILTSNFLISGCSRVRARRALLELSNVDLQVRAMGIPPIEVLEQVEWYWHENDVEARAEWLLMVSNAMFPRRRWSFFFIGW